MDFSYGSGKVFLHGPLIYDILNDGVKNTRRSIPTTVLSPGESFVGRRDQAEGHTKTINRRC